MDRKSKDKIKKGVDFLSPDPNINISISKLLTFKNTDLKEIEHIWKDEYVIDNRIKDHIQIECAYKNYINDQNREIEKMKNEYMNMDITKINYEEIKLSLRREVWEKLFHNQPKTIQAASRIPGVTLPSLLIIIQHCKKLKNSKKSYI